MEEKAWARVWKSPAAFWTAAAVLVLVVVLALSTVLMGKKDQALAPAPSTSSQGTGSGQTKCDVAPGDQSTKAPAPSDLEWKTDKGISWPVSKSLGPTKQVNGLDACFAHSPQGAALMAVNALFSQFSNKDALDFYVAEGPLKKEALKDKETGSAEDFRKSGISIAGYKVSSYSDKAATLYLVSHLPQGQTGYMGIQVTLLWDGNDWKLDPGSLIQNQQPLQPSEGDFVKWDK